MNAVPIARDYDGLKRAALEMLDESRLEPQRQRAARMAEHAQNAEQILAEAAPKRSLADGYYVRIGYLLELESAMHGGVQFAPTDIELSEMRGLDALAAARREFNLLHPPCRRCGVRLENAEVGVCPGCWQAEVAAGRG